MSINRVDAVKAIARMASMPVQSMRMADAHTKPTTDEDLWEYIAAYLGFRIPRVAVCKGHCAPFQALADLFFERQSYAVLFASRSGGKTTLLAILHHLNASHKPRYEIANIGAILEQAHKCYGYVIELTNLSWFAEDLVTKTMRLTKYRNGSIVQVLSGTIAGCNCLSGDTIIDTLDGKHRIKDLVGKEGFYVHAWDEKNRRYAIDRVIKVWKSGRAKVWKITFDKSVLFATFEHPIRLLNGDYIPAGLLRSGMHVRALNRSQRWMGNKAYWVLYPPPEKRGKQRYRPEHRWVIEEIRNEDLPSEIVVHHIDGDATNNQPWNLEPLTFQEHTKRTMAEIGVWCQGKKRPDHAEFMTELITLEKECGDYEERVKKLRESWTEDRKREWANRMSLQVSEQWKDPKRLETARKTWRNQTTIERAPWRDAEQLKQMIKEGLHAEEIGKRLGCSGSTARKWMKYHNLALDGNENNHVVMKVEPFGEEDVYDIATEIHHCFFANDVAVSNSSHPICVIFDEVELMDWQVLQEAFSMVKSAHGYQATQILTSTRKYPSGTMQRILDNVGDNTWPGYRVYSFCVFEASEKCTLPDCEQCKEVIRIRDGKPESWYDICHEEPEEHPMGKCRASDGFIALTDIMNKFVTMDWDVFDSQWRCLKPGRQGLVFPSFDELIHCKPELVNEWRGRFLADRQREKEKQELEICITIDMGWSEPLAVLFTARDKRDNLFLFDSIYETGLDLRDLAPMLRKKMQAYRLSDKFVCYCDERAPREIDELNKLGIKTEAIGASVDEKIRAFRQCLDGNYRENQPTVCIDPETCKPLVSELNTLHYKLDKEGNPRGELPEHGADHLIDTAGYMLSVYGLISGLQIVQVIRSKEPPRPPPVVPTRGDWRRWRM